MKIVGFSISMIIFRQGAITIKKENTCLLRWELTVLLEKKPH